MNFIYKGINVVVSKTNVDNFITWEDLPSIIFNIDGKLNYYIRPNDSRICRNGNPVLNNIEYAKYISSYKCGNGETDVFGDLKQRYESIDNYHTNEIKVYNQDRSKHADVLVIVSDDYNMGHEPTDLEYQIISALQSLEWNEQYNYTLYINGLVISYSWIYYGSISISEMESDARSQIDEILTIKKELRDQTHQDMVGIIQNSIFYDIPTRIDNDGVLYGTMENRCYNIYLEDNTIKRYIKLAPDFIPCSESETRCNLELYRTSQL